jgi:hypothetical protein
MKVANLKPINAKCKFPKSTVRSSTAYSGGFGVVRYGVTCRQNTGVGTPPIAPVSATDRGRGLGDRGGDAG